MPLLECAQIFHRNVHQSLAGLFGGPCDVGRDHTVGSAEERIAAANGLGRHHVHPGSGNLPGAERIRKILLDDDPNMPEGPGMVHMTGRIALAYMRDRSSGAGDFSRTERQRKVVSQLFDKCAELSLLELVGIYNEVSSGMSMNLSAMDILGVLSQGYDLLTGGADFVEFRIPQDGTYSYGQLGSSSVLNVRWQTNRDRFHALLDTPPEQ